MYFIGFCLFLLFFDAKSYPKKVAYHSTSISLRCELERAEFKGFGASPPPKLPKTEEEIQNSRSSRKKTYQKMRKLAKKSASVHKLVDGERDQKQQSQRSQGW